MYKVIGIEKIDYISKKTNMQVLGTALYLSYEQPFNKNLSGYKTERVFIKPRFYNSDISLGDNVDLSYDKYGNVQSVDIRMDV